jgi:hypothetical protein
MSATQTDSTREDWFEVGRIKASVDVILFDPADRFRGDRELRADEVASCRHKLRVTILSSLDFKTPSVERAGVYANRDLAEAMAVQARAACALLGIPVINRPELGSPLQDTLE